MKPSFKQFEINVLKYDIDFKDTYVLRTYELLWPTQQNVCTIKKQLWLYVDSCSFRNKFRWNVEFWALRQYGEVKLTYVILFCFTY